VCFGHLSIRHVDLPWWTLKDFFNAYKAWLDVHVHGPWERARVISFYTAAPHSNELKKWEDLFPLASDKKKKKKAAKTIIRETTEEEKALFKQLFPNG
jgi:hypothetical protein